MGAHFSKVAMCFLVFMLFVGILEIAVLPAWEFYVRDFVEVFINFLHQKCKTMKFSSFSLFPPRAKKMEKERGRKRRVERRVEQTRGQKSRAMGTWNPRDPRAAPWVSPQAPRGHGPRPDQATYFGNDD